MSALPRRRHDDVAPLRSVDDDGTVSARVALDVQQLIEAILGDDTFTLAEVAHLLGRLAESTCDGLLDSPERRVWTLERSDARCAELDDVYNPPEQLGGDINPLHYCPTCCRRIVDTDDRGMEADDGQRWCIDHWRDAHSISGEVSLA